MTKASLGVGMARIDDEHTLESEVGKLEFREDMMLDSMSSGWSSRVSSGYELEKKEEEKRQTSTSLVKGCQS